MRRETTLVMRIVWDSDEVSRPGRWDWANLIDVERGHVEIVADSDDAPKFRTVDLSGPLNHGN